MRRAFTLMEVLIVLGILSVLIGIAVPRIKGFQDQAKKQKAQSGLKILQTAVEAYYMRHNAYPPQTDTLSADYLMGEESPKIDEVLYDPFGATPTTEYRYSVGDDGQTYALSSLGLDRINGTARVTTVTSSGGDDLVVSNGTITELDVATDENNCGAIGTECADGEVCTNGACAAPTVTIYGRSDLPWDKISLNGVYMVSSEWRVIATQGYNSTVYYVAYRTNDNYIIDSCQTTGGTSVQDPPDLGTHWDGASITTTTTDVYLTYDAYYDD